MLRRAIWKLGAAFADDILVAWYQSIWEHGKRLCDHHMYGNADLYDKINLVYKTNIWAENASQMWHNVQPRYAHNYLAHPEQVLPLLHHTSEEAD